MSQESFYNREIKLLKVQKKLIPTKLRAGFNLIEAAIVLGVVGLIIGGIWISAAAVNDQFKINSLAKDILRIVSETRTLVTDADYPTVTNTGNNITSTLIAANIILGSMVRSATNAVTPWGGEIGVGLGNYGGKKIHVVLTGIASQSGGLTQELCNKLVRKMVSLLGSNGDKSYGLYVIYADPSLIMTHPFDFAGRTCPTSPNNLQFQFKP